MQSKQTLLEVQHLPNFPRLILSVLTEDGYDEDELLKGLDLSPKQLADETFRLSANQHEKFILRVLTITNDLPWPCVSPKRLISQHRAWRLWL